MKIGIVLISEGFAGLEKAVHRINKFLRLKNDVTLFLNDEIYKYYQDIQGIKTMTLGKYSTKNLISIQKSLYILKNNLSK